MPKNPFKAIGKAFGGSKKKSPSSAPFRAPAPSGPALGGASATATSMVQATVGNQNTAGRLGNADVKKKKRRRVGKKRDIKGLGAGTANEVFKVNYKDGGGTTTGFYKPDQKNAPAKYAVGASRLADAAGMSDLIPETKFAEHKIKGQMTRGAVSRGVDGAVPLSAHGDLVDKRAEYEKLGMTWNEQVDDMKSGGFLAGQGFTLDEKHGRLMGPGASKVNEQVDLKNPLTQAGLNRLQWFDSLSANVDRHGGNILIDPLTGKVSGIDNDLSFARGVQADNDEFVRGKVTQDDKYLGLPDLIDRATADKLSSLEWKALKAQLTNAADGKDEKLDKTDLKQTKSRLKAIKEHIASLEDSGGIVDAWDDSTFDRQVNASRDNRTGSPSYLVRHLDQMKKAADPLNKEVEAMFGGEVKVPQVTPPAPAPADVKAAAPTVRVPASTRGKFPSAPPPSAPASTTDTKRRRPQKVPARMPPLPPTPVGADTKDGGGAVKDKVKMFENLARGNLSDGH